MAYTTRRGFSRNSKKTADGEKAGGLIRIADRMSKIAVTTMIVAAILFGSFMAITSYSDNAVKNYIIKAGQFFDEGEYQKAADLYSKYLVKYPDSKTAMLGFIEASIETDRAKALEYAIKLLDSGALAAADYPQFIKLCERIGDHELNVEAYTGWLQISPGQTSAMIELAKAHISKGALNSALDIITSLSDTGNREAAAVLLGRAADRAKNIPLSDGDIISLCEMWYAADDTNPDALLALAGAYADSGMEAQAEECYREALGMNVRNAIVYDGLLNLLYRNDRLRDRYDLLEMAVRNIGGKKYQDMLDTVRLKLADYYSLIREDGITYRDGIFRITRFDPSGNEILSESSDIYGPDEISYLIEYYDNLGNLKEMYLDSAKMQTQIADIDYDGYREVLIKRYITADGMSAEAMSSAFWYDVFRIDRELNKLIYSTPDFPNFYKDTYALELSRKTARFEKLSEAMEGHYGVVYGLLYALRAAALDFSNGEWAPDGTGVDLRERICQTLIVPELEQYVADKNTIFGFGEGDIRILAPGMSNGGGDVFDIYPGMTEEDVTKLLGPPRYITEEEMKAVRPDGENAEYLNRIVEYAGLNLYVSDGAVKAIRVNSRDYEGPRALRIGDTARDIVNKFPASYFDDTADFIIKKADSDIEFMDTERGIVLNYSVKNGIVMNIELYIRDSSGDWKPGTNIETIIPPGGSAEADGAEAAGGAADGAANGTEAANGAASGSAEAVSADAAGGAADGAASGAEAASADGAAGGNIAADNAASQASDNAVAADGAAATVNGTATGNTSENGATTQEADDALVDNMAADGSQADNVAADGSVAGGLTASPAEATATDVAPVVDSVMTEDDASAVGDAAAVDNSAAEDSVPAVGDVIAADNVTTEDGASAAGDATPADGDSAADSSAAAGIAGDLLPQDSVEWQSGPIAVG